MLLGEGRSKVKEEEEEGGGRPLKTGFAGDMPPLPGPRQ